MNTPPLSGNRTISVVLETALDGWCPGICDRKNRIPEFRRFSRPKLNAARLSYIDGTDS
jgi:hypothetical protein